MSYCQTHGRFDDYFNRGCPQCQYAEEELRNAVSQAAYTSVNPGDYDCPHCKYRSLKAAASRCPLCHGEVSTDYWNDVRAKEEIAAHAFAEREKATKAEAAAEHLRMAPVRAAAANAVRKRDHDQAVSQAVLGVFLVLGVCFVGGLIACGVVAAIASILGWNVGVSVAVVFVGMLAIAWWRISVEVVRHYKDSETKSEAKRRSSL